MNKKTAIIGVPFDLGAGKRGAAGGPAAIRRTELSKFLETIGAPAEDWGDVSVSASNAKPGSSKLRYASAIKKMCEQLSEKTHAALSGGYVPVVLGGDHSLAMGSIAGVARHFAQKKKKIGVIWVDAHGDFNTPQTSPTGNVHGMPLAHLVGLGDKSLNRIAGFAPAVSPENVCIVGARDLDDGEKVNLRKAGVKVFTMADIDRFGMASISEQAIECAGQGTAGVHVSFDIDATDPSISPGVGTPKRGGLTYREAHLFMEIVAQSGRMVSLDMTEVNPLEDSRNATAEVASELIQSALGKRIY